MDEWLVNGRQHIAAARAGTFVDRYGRVVASDVAGWPEPWIAADLLTYDLETIRALEVETVLSQPHALTIAAVGDLDAALDRAREPNNRLAALEDAWRACLDPEIADLIEALDVSLPLPKFAAPKKKADLELQWAAFAKTASPRGAVAIAWPAKWKDAQRRMRALYQRPRSPLLAAAVAQFAVADNVPYTSVGSQVFWTGVAWFLAEQGDMRQLDRLEQLERRIGIFTGRSELPASAALRALARPALAAAARAKLAGFASPPPQAAIKLSLASADERAVAADQLLAAGDPRGEFITVQQRVVAEPTPQLIKRQAALLKKHAKAWCPSVVQRERCVFRGGVPVAGYLAYRSDSELESLVGSPALATFETLIIDGSSLMGSRSIAKTVCAVVRALPALRCLVTLHTTAGMLGNGPPCPIDHLVIVRGAVPKKPTGRGLPELRRVDVESIPDDWLTAGWLGELAEIGCQQPARWDAVWRELARRSNAPRCVLVDHDYLHPLESDGETSWEVVIDSVPGGAIAIARPRPGATAKSLVASLSRVPAWDGIASVSVPSNFASAIAPLVRKHAVAVTTTAAVEVASLGISLAMV